MQGVHRKGSFYDREWQNEPFTPSEDCLYLNVWTPANSPDEKLLIPTVQMVWDHLLAILKEAPKK